MNRLPEAPEQFDTLDPHLIVDLQPLHANFDQNLANQYPLTENARFGQGFRSFQLVVLGEKRSLLRSTSNNN